MGKVVSSCRRALLGWFLMFVPLPDSAEADGSAMRPLTASLTVIHPCRVEVPDAAPEKVASKNPAALINMLCHETAAWRVEIKERVRKTVDDFTPHRPGADPQLTINC